MLRRELFKTLASCLVGASLFLVPIGAGIVFLLDPLRRGALRRGFRRVTSIDSLPFGIPRSFTVTGTRTDAWETTPNVPIGAVYLIRLLEEIQAFQVTCPHAGCFVDYDPDNQQSLSLSREFLQPRWFHQESSESRSPWARSTRGHKVEGTEVLVRYQEFRKGIRKQITVS